MKQMKFIEKIKKVRRDDKSPLFNSYFYFCA